MFLTARNSQRGRLSGNNDLSFYAPLTTSLTPTKGTIDGFSRALAAYVECDDGQLHLVKSGEARFWGARRVENLFYLQFLTGATTRTDNYDDSATVSGLTTTNANRINIHTNTSIVAVGAVVRASIYIKADVAGNVGKDITLRIYSNGGTAGTAATITLTADYQRVTMPLKTSDNTNGQEMIWIFGAATNNATGFTYKYPQIEDVTGHTNQNPGEYVRVGVDWATNILSGNNTNFTTGLGDWYNPEPARGTISHDTNRIKIVNDGTGGYAKAAYVYPFKKGRLYAVHAVTTVTAGTAGMGLSTSSWVAANTISGSSGVLTGTFAPTSDYDYLLIFVNSGTADGRYATFDNICISEITHGANVDGVKNFSTENGNTVASNIVTEATGAALSTIYGYYGEWTRTNSITYSEQFDNAVWTKERMTVTANAAQAPSGYTTADRLIEDATAANTHRMYSTSVSCTSGVIYSLSIYLKAGTRTRARIVGGGAAFGSDRGVDVNLSAGTITATVGTITTSQIYPMANGWYRVEVSLAATATGSGLLIVYLADGTGATSYNGDGASYIDAWGAQFEAGKPVTSYIPTTTASVARPTDLLAYANPHTNFNAQGSCYGEFVTPRANTVFGSSHNFRIIGNTSNANGALYGDPSTPAVGIYDAPNAGVRNISAWSAKTTVKGASSWGGTTMRASSGGANGSDNTFDGNMHNSVTTFNIGIGNSDSTQIAGGVKNIKVWKKTFAAARLNTLTT